jgi:hypothetical protein
MQIKSLAVLRDLADEDDTVREILEDTLLGRRNAVKQIFAQTEYIVSDSLVRSYREYMQAAKTYPEGMEVPLNSVGYLEPPVRNYIDLSNPFEPKVKPFPTFATPDTKPAGSTVTFLPYKEKPKTIVVMPDVQAPLHDVALVDKFIQFIKDFHPTEIAQVGDFTDSTEISRWVRGKKPEFAGDLSGGFKTARGILADIREVFDGRFRIVRSNHDDRLELYIENCAPGLASFMDDELSLETLMHFNKYDVEFIRDEVVELAPGWVMAHGDEGSLSPSAGKTAFGLAKNKFGVSTVCGHTHRAGMTSESTGYNGQIRNTLTGLEVGHFMDLTKADYLKKKGVAANWQQAFGILEVYGQRVYPRLVTVQDGCFSVDGVQY